LCNHHCYKFSPLQAHWGRWCYTCILWLACLFTVHMGSVPFPLSSGAFLMTATVKSFPPPRLLGGCRHSCLLWPAYLFTVPWAFAPLPHLVLKAPRHLCHVSFVVVVVYSVLFFSLFSLVGGQSVQEAMLIWSRVVCGSTACCLAHLVVCVS
jgi:hypothetical protein